MPFPHPPSPSLTPFTLASPPSSTQDMRAFNERLAQDPRVLATLVPLSYGITVCLKVLHLDGPTLADARDAVDAGNTDPLRSMLLERRAEAKAALDAL